MYYELKVTGGQLWQYRRWDRVQSKTEMVARKLKMIIPVIIVTVLVFWIVKPVIESEQYKRELKDKLMQNEVTVYSISMDSTSAYVSCSGFSNLPIETRKQIARASYGNAFYVMKVEDGGENYIGGLTAEEKENEKINKNIEEGGIYYSKEENKWVNTEPALTKAEADALRGTGYHGTRPNSSAEDIEINGAMVKCKVCGMRTHNGRNSKCDACLYNSGEKNP